MPNTNKPRLNGMLRGIQKSIAQFQSQGYDDVYFKAQFIRDGRKQNGIERGDITKFVTQIRAYVESEDADAVKLEFFDDSTGKAIYAKSISGLRDANTKGDGNKGSGFGGFGSVNGLGEAEFNSLVDQRVDAKERNREFIRISKENDDFRSKIEALEAENDELEASLKAKKDVEYYMGIIGTVFPGLSTLFQGTRLANAASFLAGTSDLQGQALPAGKEAADSETQSISAMVSEFCDTLTVQEAGIVHLLFMAFERDRNQMQRALQFISQTPVTT